MYEHHKESLRIMAEHYRRQPGVIALIFGGSVAKGIERPDSDLDGMAVVSQEEFDRRVATSTSTEMITGQCTYPEGYFDVKYITKDFLRLAAEKGSEPTRSSFYKAQVLFSDDPEIAPLIARIAEFQQSEKAENFVPMCRAFCETFDDALFDRILAAYKAWTRWPHPTDLNIIASRRQLDFEKWWYIPRPLIAEW